MNKPEFLQLLKSHKWNYDHLDGDSYREGKAEWHVICYHKNNDPELMKTYEEFKNNRF